MEYKDYYKILGVPRTASEAEIKRAYRKLAREFHPDKNKAKGAEDRFKSANEANEVLSDPKKRAAYDQLGANWQNGQRFTPPPGWTTGRAGAGGFAAGGDAGGFSDFFSSLFGGAGGGFGGGPSGFEDAVGGGRDQQAKLAISLEDSFQGSTRSITLGSRALNVRIPKGVTAGQTVRLSGQAPRGGDVLLEISFAPHAQFKAEGRDIHATLNIAPWEAALGGSVPVPTLGGAVELNLPPNTSAGRKLRLKGRGLPASPPGDQFVTIQIVAPPAETEAQKQTYEQLRTLFIGFNPRA
ncbi:MAG: DnaJ C-terminal domain-containing protein [Nevskia sp.]